jgi:low temperature requirement protein LtrA
MRTPEGESVELTVSPLELFFDLVFVFAVTQTVSLVLNNQSVTGVLGGALVFFMLWWAWQQYTWGINSVGNERFGVRLALVLAMGLSLFMALVVTEAFAEEGRLFGIAYTLVLFVGLALFYAGLDTTEERQVLLKYLPLAVAGGLVVLVGSFLPPSWRVGAWVAGMALELLATITAEGYDFNIQPGHFAERHGLFVILALGETIVAIGLSAADLDRTLELTIALGTAFLGAVIIWWLYFGRFASRGESALRTSEGGERTQLARDLYTMWHFPLIFGIVLYAVTAEEVVSHPDSRLSSSGQWIFALAITLTVYSLIAVVRRAGGPLLWERGIAGLVVIGIALVVPVTGWVVVALFVAAMVVAQIVEGRRLADRINTDA